MGIAVYDASGRIRRPTGHSEFATMAGMADEQDKPKKTRRHWFQFRPRPIKRAMYEWGAIFAAAFFGLLLTYWVFSLFSSNGVFVLLACPPRVHLLASGGKIELASDANCREFFASIDGNSAWLKSFLTSDKQYTLPGFQYRSVTYREEGGNR